MSENFVCSFCSNHATRTCFCSASRIYLCEACQQVHTTEGVHPLAPVGFSSLVNFQQYLERNKHAVKMIEALDKLQGHVANERLSLQAEIENCCEKQLRELKSAYDDSQKVVSGFYEKRVAEIEEMKASITRGLEGEGKLSNAAREVIALGLHFPPPSPFLTTHTSGFATIHFTPPQLPAISHITQLLTKPSISCCCEECETLISQLLPVSSWKCQRCGFAANLTDECKLCDQVKSQPVRSQCWVCPECSYKYNSKTACKMCAYEIATWACSHCGVRNNSKSTSCGQCRSLRYPQSPPPAVLERAGDRWLCLVCNKLNPRSALTCFECKNIRKWCCWECARDNPITADRCEACTMPKQWDEFLVCNKVELSQDRTKWRCSKCGKYTPVDVDKCGKCRWENQVIAKGKQHKGRELSLSRRLLSMIFS